MSDRPDRSVSRAIAAILHRLPPAAAAALVVGAPALIAPFSETMAADAQQTAAQGTPPQPEATTGGPTQSELSLKEVVVTGSNIPVSAQQSDVQLQILGQKDIAASGIQSNPLDLLRKTVPSFAGGRSNTGNSNSSNTSQLTGGGSQIALLGMPTLVLLDGRRITYSSLNASGGKNFVDVNMIPLSAIDHIEVLSDGASAIYGSDAIGGVVNIILKHNFNGVEVGGRHAQTDGNDYGERSAYFVAGTSTDSTSVTVTGNWSATDPLLQSQRPFISNDPRSNLSLPGSVGGDILNYDLRSPSQTNPTGNNAVAAGMPALIADGTYLSAKSPLVQPFNIAPYTSLLQATELESTTLNFDVEFSDKIALFGNALLSKTQTSNELATSLTNLVQVGVTVPADSPYNPTTSDVSKVVVGTTDNPQQTINDAHEFLYTIGLRGNIIDSWNWEVGYTQSGSMVEQLFTNTVFEPAVAAAIAGGYDANGNAMAGGAYSKVIGGFNVKGPLVLQPALDPFARSGVNPASLANVYGTEAAATHASLSSADIKINGTPFTLPAGKVAVAIGGARRREAESATPDDNSYNLSTNPAYHNWASGAFFLDPFSRDRTVTAYYAEIFVPITSPKWNAPGLHAFDVSLAGRDERYSDAGNSRVPKIGLRWQPFDGQVTARFTYSKSFAAPTLYDEYGPPNYPLEPLAVPSGLNPGVIAYDGSGNNPQLGPAYALSRTFGLTLAPRFARGLTLTADYLDVFISGYQVGIGTNLALPSIEALGSASPYFSTVSVNAPPGQPGATQAPISAPGSLYAFLNSPSYANNFYYLDHKINAGGILVKALNFSLDYDRSTERMGSFSASVVGSYLITDKASPSPVTPMYEFAGYSASISGFGGSLAKLSTYSTFDWAYHDWDLTIGNFYRTHMVDINAGSFPAVWTASHPTVYVPSYMTWDASVGYTIGQLSTSGFTRFLHGLTLRAGVTNLFNRMPPAALLSYPASKGNSYADTATYSPIGRLVYVSGSIRF